MCVAILRVYRAVISPLYGDVCRYYPSCSRYALEAIQQHGAVKGIALGLWRIVRCNPWAKGGIDDVPHTHHHRYTVTAHGFVTARPELAAGTELAGSPVLATSPVQLHSPRKA
ncbi:membrane protein insertion efficiency factor YidD [Frondihabitans sp. PAMC 28766]|uniref:membrane protein insertion efficiency factor YidD n=1 Tax=Frondihabitans sp. PAMC 28766 TaxID=1795630 RepID=UPI0009E7B302|nr:membrane protein insertion efficiency factor YidD [Frondihabitans sp. PAMC 28766]